MAIDIVSQLLLKWERFGPNTEIDPTDDFTRLALDTIVLCSMSFRLNSFYAVCHQFYLPQDL
jgi:cytochrome P450 / NADPH-cytochrome P450 reductase